jgi:hypothetical protein
LHQNNNSPAALFNAFSFGLEIAQIVRPCTPAVCRDRRNVIVRMRRAQKNAFDRFRRHWLDPAGVGLLLKGLLGDTVLTVVTALIGIAALAGGVQNWFLRLTSRAERAMLIAAGLPRVYPGPVADGIGLALVIAVVAMQKRRRS